MCGGRWDVALTIPLTRLFKTPYNTKPLGVSVVFEGRALTRFNDID